MFYFGRHHRVIVVRQSPGVMGALCWLVYAMFRLIVITTVIFWLVVVPWLWREVPIWWASFQAWRARRAADRDLDRPVHVNELVRVYYAEDIHPGRVVDLVDYGGTAVVQLPGGVVTVPVGGLIDPVDAMPTTGDPCGKCGRRSGSTRAVGGYQPAQRCPRHRYIPPPPASVTAPIGGGGQARARG